jgi:hypothetical protein
MRARELVMVSAAAALFLGVFALAVMAEDAVKVSPDKYRVVFENEKVRLLEYRDKPGDVSKMHSHPAHLVYVFDAAKRKFLFADGKTAVVDLKAGDTIWGDAYEHAGENIGTTETHALIFELK